MKKKYLDESYQAGYEQGIKDCKEEFNMYQKALKDSGEDWLQMYKQEIIRETEEEMKEKLKKTLLEIQSEFTIELHAYKDSFSTWREVKKEIIKNYTKTIKNDKDMQTL